MPGTARFAERIGKVYLPEADVVDTAEDFAAEDFTPNPQDPFPTPNLPGKLTDPRLPFQWPPEQFWPRICRTTLKQGCYTLSFTPKNTPIFGTRYRGTLRVERLTGRNIRFSGDFYSRRLIDDLLSQGLFERSIAGRFKGADLATDADEVAADTGGAIPIYPRHRYHSYLKGTSAQLFKFVMKGTPCSFSLEFDQFVYNHPAAGFNGSFSTTRTRAIRFVLRHAAEPDFYTGEAYEGTTLLGSVSMRWISTFYRRATLQLNTLQGFESPPASVGSSTFSSIFADVGWDVTCTDGGGVPLPPALAGINVLTCWSMEDLHTLMSSVPGYNPAALDSVWRVHLVAVPAVLGCSRGVMFDTLGASPNAVAREGSATFSRDGYPSDDTSHYDTAENQQQRNVPRAFLRSATHEVGHAFNQIHQSFEGGDDNSIMTPTPSVAEVLGVAGTFPDDINLAFNDTVKRHLRHLPDPAVRPGAMDFFGSAVSAPEAADVAWPEVLELAVNTSSDQVHLGEPVEVTFALRNTSEAPIPAPATLDIASLVVRINVTDPTGRITFMRPATVASCPKLRLATLAPGGSVTGSTAVYWGRDGFAFETPGRHVVEVIILWNIAGVPVGASGTRDVFVNHPVSQTDNDVAALLLDPEVGKAVATGRAWLFERGAARIKKAASIAKGHPATRMIAKMAVLEAPPRASARPKAARRRAAPAKRRPSRKG